MAGRPTVTLHHPAVPEHATQVSAGLDLLASRGEISVRFARDVRLAPLASHGTLLSIAHGPTIAIDLVDSPRSFSEAALANADFYFKRMYVSDHVPRECRASVHPYGLNYSVMSSRIGLRSLMRPFMWRSRDEARRVMRALIGAPLRHHASFRGTDRDYSYGPVGDTSRVLFLARAWSPHSPETADDPTAQEDRFRVNEERAELIRLLRSAFGPAFTGGFSRDAFSAREYPDLVVQDSRVTSRPAFVETVKQHGICIATRGLHGSVGWKFAEYIAMARAIVSEQFSCEFPFALREGMHYLEFATPAACVERVALLIREPSMAVRMMRENQALYSRHVQPANLVHRMLRVAGVLR